MARRQEHIMPDSDACGGHREARLERSRPDKERFTGLPGHKSRHRQNRLEQEFTFMRHYKRRKTKFSQTFYEASITKALSERRCKQEVAMEGVGFPSKRTFVWTVGPSSVGTQPAVRHNGSPKDSKVCMC